LSKMLFVSMAIFLSMFTFAVPVYAIQVPLQVSNRNAYPIKDDNITLISFQASLRVRPAFTSVDTSMVIRNDSTSEANIVMGIPSKYDVIVTIKQPSVIVEGQKQKLTTLRASQNAETPDIFSPPNWSTYTLKLAPGQTKVIKSTFTMDNKFDQSGLRIIYLPLSYLNVWKGSINYMQIVADLDFYPPYVFEPNPSTIPTEYDTGGRLVWRFLDVKQPENLLLYFYPVEMAVANYLKQNAQNNSDITNIVSLYEKADYDNAIASIVNFLEANPSFPLNTELKYLKALCHMELYQPGMALEIFNNIENSPGFGEQLSNVVRNKIIYDKTFLLKLRGKEDEVLEYLKQVRPSLKNNAVFIRWVEDEIKRLSPPPPPPEEPDETINEQPEPQQQDTLNNSKTIKYINIFGYDVPVEFIFTGIILIIVILIINFKRRKRKKRYLF